MTEPSLALEAMAAQVLRSLPDKPDGVDTQQYIDGQVELVVPSDTATLFGLVVDEPSIAFLEYEGEDPHPFHALYGAIARRVELLVEEHRQAGE